MRNAAGEFHYLEPALDVAARVGQRLAVLGREQFGEAVVFFLHQFEELEHHAGAPLRIGRRPGWLRRLRVGDGMLDLGMLGQRHLGLHLAGIGIEDVAEASGGPFDGVAPDEMANLTHGSLLRFLGVLGRDLRSSVSNCRDFCSLLPGGHGQARLRQAFFFHERLAFTAS